MISKKTKREPIYNKIPTYITSVIMVITAITAIPVEFQPDGLSGELISSTLADLCIAGKEILLFSAAALLLFWFVGERIFPEHPLKAPLADKKMNIVAILSGSYLLWALISTLFSEYREVGFLGFPSVLEGLAAVFGYIILLLSGYNYFGGSAGRKLLPYIITAALALISVMAITELSTKPLSELFFGTSDERTGMALLFGNSTVCAEVCTLLCLPAMALAYDEETAWKRLLRGILAGMALLCVVCSYSSAAFFVLAFCLTALTVFTIATGKSAPIRVITAFGACLVPLAVFAAAQPARAAGYIRAELYNSGVYSAEDTFGIEEITADGDSLHLRGNSSELTIIVNDGRLSFFSDSGELIPVINGNTAAFTDPGYEMVSVQQQDRLVQIDLGYDDVIPFEITGDVFQYIDPAGYLSDITPTAFPELSQYFSMGTGRVYIWLQTLPLLKDRLITGTGAGAFPFVYPQSDVAGMLRTHGAILLTTKPHNMYLQIFTEYGLPALLLFAALAVVISTRGAKGALRSPGVLPAGLAASWAAWLAMGLVNDSAVPYSMWAWFFAGVLLTFSGDKQNEK